MGWWIDRRWRLLTNFAVLTAAWTLIAFQFYGFGRGVLFAGVLFLIVATILFSLPFLLVSEIYREMCRRPLPPETVLLVVPLFILAIVLMTISVHALEAAHILEAVVEDAEHGDPELPEKILFAVVMAQALAFTLTLTYGHIRNALTRPRERV